MDILEAILASGFVGWKIAVPILRMLSSVLFAFAVSKDCKSRHNGSAPLWGFMTLISPFIFGIIYFVYSRFLSDKVQDECRNKKGERQAKILCLTGIFMYVVMVVVLIVSIIISVSSAAAYMLTEDTLTGLIAALYSI